MSAATSSINSYEEAIAGLPPTAFLGSLLYFTISEADVNWEKAREELANVGLSISTMRKILRPVDAFKKSTREFAHKFKPVNGVRSEIMVRPVGEDGEQAYRHLILERTVVQAGKKRQIFYEKIGDITFTRGIKKDGEYTGYSVESRRTTNFLSSPLTEVEDAWLTSRLEEFEERFDHLMHFMDSHAVRSMLRNYIKEDLSGTLVKESGSLYFVKQDHADEVAKLSTWIKSIGSDFHALPLLNLAEQRQEIFEAFEDETVKEVDSLIGEIGTILKDPDRQITEKTFDRYGIRAAELTQRVNEYNALLGARAERATIEIQAYSAQVMQLAGRIKQSKSHTLKVLP